LTNVKFLKSSFHHLNVKEVPRKTKEVRKQPAY